MINLRFIFALLLLVFSLKIQAQISDNFSDGDFSNNPAWTGSTTLFQVNAGFELQSNGNAATDTIHLSTPNSLLNNTEWHIKVNMPFAPSANNFVRIYLVSDQANLEAALNGYFLLIGENLSNDAIKLYRQDGTALTLLGTGTLGAVATNPNVGIKVSRDAAGLWTLFADYTGGGTYTQEFTATDNTYTATAHFGLFVRHTSTNNNKHYFDNVYVGPPIVDNTPPQITSLSVLSPTELDVFFDEAVELATSQNNNNYGVNNGIGTPISAVRDNANPALVHLSFLNSFPTGTHTLTVSNVKDLNNNAINPPATSNFSYVQTSVPVWGDVLINEIMADPTPVVGLPDAEFLELYNKSNKNFDLSGWQIRKKTSFATLGSFVLQAGQHVVVTANSQTTLFTPLTSNVVGATSWSAPYFLDNGGASLELISDGGVSVDSVNYSINWYKDAAKDDGGWTLERINPNPGACVAIADNWKAAIDALGGTPAAQNSVYDPNTGSNNPSVTDFSQVSANSISICFSTPMDATTLADVNNYNSTVLGVAQSVTVSPDNLCVEVFFNGSFQTGTSYTVTVQNLKACDGTPLPLYTNNIYLSLPPQYKDVIINELMPTPSPPVLLPNAEYVELYNRSNQPLNLKDWILTDGSSNGKIQDYTLNPNSYVLLTSTTNAALFGSITNVVAVTSFPTLNNSGDNLGLRTPAGVLMDSIRYTTAWYGASGKENGGWSLELKNPNSPCSSSANWGPSDNMNGGTPGVQNSIFSSSPDVLPPALFTSELLTLDTVRLCFTESMDVSTLITANFIMSGGVSVTSVLPVEPDNQCVLLKLSPAIVAGNIYNLSIQNVKDCSGNLIPAAISTPIVKGLAAQPFEVVITEIFPDPSPSFGLPEAEFIELHNRTNKVIDISNWRFQDDGTTAAQWGNMSLLPNEYVIVCAQSNAALFTQYGRVIGTSAFPSLNNDKDSLYLFNDLDFVQDYVFFTDDWYRDNVKKNGGYTLERIDANFTNCNTALNWIASNATIGGTPAAVNSQAGTFSDTEKPTILGVQILSNIELKVFFSEVLDAASASNSTNFSIDNGIGTPALAAPTYSEVVLVLAQTIQPQQLYRLIVNNLKDCAGNAVTDTVFFGIPDTIRKGDVYLNEFLFNSYTGGSDFVELVNVSDKVLDLSQLRLGKIAKDSAFQVSAVSAYSFLMLPKSTVCVTKDIDFQKATYNPPANAKFFQMSELPAYGTTKDGIVLISAQNDTLDKLDYDKANVNLPVFEQGVSWERVSWTDNACGYQWQASAAKVKYATPGYANVQVGSTDCVPTGGILINEVLFNPITGGSDYVEIYNNTNQSLKLSNFILAEIDQGDTEIKNHTHLFGENDTLKPGEILCLTTNVSGQKNQYLPPNDAQFMQMSSIPSYDDGEGTVILLNRKGEILDQFQYLDDYQHPALNDDNGVALERISLSSPTQNPSNWHSAASTVRYGTPGYPNSQRLELTGGDEQVWLEYDTFTPNGDGDKDMLPILYKFPFQGGNGRINIFDTNGNQIKKLLLNQLFSPDEGVFFWDGTNDKSQRVPVGMYVVVFEIQDTASGKLYTFKKVCVVGDKL